MVDIFLSYSREDREIMQQIRHRLQAAGLSVWTDDNLAPGTPSWVRAIEKALDSAGCMVVLFSPFSKQSDWVREELDYARHQQRRIFPVLVAGDEGSSVPFGFSTTNWVDIRFDMEQPIEHLIVAIHDFLGERQTGGSGRAQQYRDFWTSLLQRSEGKTHLFARVSPGPDNWISTGAGRTGLSYGYVLTRDSAVVDFYIDTGDKGKNKALFDALFRHKEAIEADFGESLDWQRLDDNRASRIRKIVGSRRSFLDQAQWHDLQDALIDAMIRLDRALRQRFLDLES
jgi:hypothetical protein